MDCNGSNDALENIQHDILLIIAVALFILFATGLEGSGLFPAPVPTPII